MVEILHHVDTFVQEAKERGIDLQSQVESLSFEFHDELIFDGKDFCGYVPLTQDGAYSKNVLFALEGKCWGDRTRLEHEALIFHELGHAVLDRVHKENLLANGSKASIMNSEPSSLYGETTENKRVYYIDELFDSTTPAPDWSK